MHTNPALVLALAGVAATSTPAPCPKSWWCEDWPCDINGTAPDLIVPTVSIHNTPQPGKRVRATLPGWAGSTHHILYLPPEWTPSRKWPVLFDLAGNGPFHDNIGDSCDGTVEGQSLGYGISGGVGYIWVAAPYITNNRSANQHQWWGDSPSYEVTPTLEYHQQLVQSLVANYHADASKVILTGFSRGALAVSYLGLYNDVISPLWAGFVAYAHFDGRDADLWVPYPDHDPDSAKRRLQRLDGRPFFVCEKMCGANETKLFLEQSGIGLSSYTFETTGFRNHNDKWVLRPSIARNKLRHWLSTVVNVTSY